MGAFKPERDAVGATPFGFQRDGPDLVELPAEMEIVRRMQALRDVGLSFRAIAARLNARQIPTKRGRRWRAASVRGVLCTAERLGVT